MQTTAGRQNIATSQKHPNATITYNNNSKRCNKQLRRQENKTNQILQPIPSPSNSCKVMRQVFGACPIAIRGKDWSHWSKTDTIRLATFVHWFACCRSKNPRNPLTRNWLNWSRCQEYFVWTRCLNTFEHFNIFNLPFSRSDPGVRHPGGWRHRPPGSGWALRGHRHVARGNGGTFHDFYSFTKENTNWGSKW